MRQRSAFQISAAILGIHGLVEVGGPIAFLAAPSLVGLLFPENTWFFVSIGVIWGATRLAAAAGILKMKKWAVALGITLEIATFVVAASLVPFGIIDMALAAPVLALLFYAWFGSEKLSA
ncbi:MAG: hypothetical protein PHH26_08920 [Candidatus Thermoplasmatota archaeon]|nr:hypothetical protein [Candidatus Thermoplasmatota archaeon]